MDNRGRIKIRVQGAVVDKFRIEREGNEFRLAIIDSQYGKFYLNDSKIEILPEQGTGWIEVTTHELIALFMAYEDE